MLHHQPFIQSLWNIHDNFIIMIKNHIYLWQVGTITLLDLLSKKKEREEIKWVVYVHLIGIKKLLKTLLKF